MSARVLRPGYHEYARADVGYHVLSCRGTKAPVPRPALSMAGSSSCSIAVTTPSQNLPGPHARMDRPNDMP